MEGSGDERWWSQKKNKKMSEVGMTSFFHFVINKHRRHHPLTHVHRQDTSVATHTLLQESEKSKEIYCDAVLNSSPTSLCFFMLLCLSLLPLSLLSLSLLSLSYKSLVAPRNHKLRNLQNFRPPASSSGDRLHHDKTVTHRIIYSKLCEQLQYPCLCQK